MSQRLPRHVSSLMASVNRNSASAITNNDDVIASGSFKGLQ